MGNTNTTEKKATNIIEATILNCPFLEPYIDNNDKTPSWDGNVFVYWNREHDKDNFRGKVPVQVKGTKKLNLNQEEIFYPVQVSDLVNYKQDGGIIYFVVYLNDNNEHQIYYAMLLPYDLFHILKNIGRQNRKNIKFLKYPEYDTNEITNIFVNFLVDRPKQMAVTSKNISLESLKDNGVEIENLSFTVTGLGISDKGLGNFVTTHQFYIYARPKGLDIEIPVDKLSNAIFSANIDKKVEVDGKMYYSSCTIIYINGDAIVEIGKSVRVRNLNNKRATLDYKFSGNLSERIKDVDFLIAVLESGTLTINDITFNLETKDNDQLVIDMQRHLDYLKKVKLMLDQLNVVEELECSKVSANEEEIIRALIDSLVFHRNIHLNNTTDTITYGTLHIANLAIMVFCFKQNDDLYRVENFFKDHTIMYSPSVEGLTSLKGSHYMLLDKCNFLHTSNIDYEQIYESLIGSEPSEHFFNLAILLLLDMINAYDEQENKDDKLFNLAEKFCNWLSQKQPGPIMKLNQLQLVKRKRAFLLEECAELALIKTLTTDTSILCGVNILLENFDAANELFGNLSIEKRQEFINYPIFHLWKKLVP